MAFCLQSVRVNQIQNRCAISLDASKPGNDDETWQRTLPENHRPFHQNVSPSTFCEAVAAKKDQGMKEAVRIKSILINDGYYSPGL
jgi:hypothetical protein